MEVLQYISLQTYNKFLQTIIITNHSFAIKAVR
jgi:hypothetical protein